MLGQMAKLLDAIRVAIEASEESRYRIAQASKVAESQLSRLMSGEAGIGIETLERLAEHLGYEIVLRPKPRRRK
jgi:transcriptional regulator with XRE-family HTH domain